ncbi:fumarylacetoacetate hydrolase family protein [Georgenia sp. Z1491]|uniref:fumarylacetoacetate hydrolase family protein n=1 Tax=Georgenia sp. Z1491 TaxID=3416707 RepID=UPI003CE71C70
MRLATLRRGGGTFVARVEGDVGIEVPGYGDVAHLLRGGGLAEAATADGERHDLTGADLAAVVTTPGKVVCVGLNYRNHILEMGRDLPEYPTLFTKYADALIGPYDDIVLPTESPAVDWEGELAVVVGTPVRRVDEEEAAAAIAGYTVANDITMRDWQYRTTQWFQGKAWEASTPVGPHLVTPDELTAGAELVTRLDGREMQRTPVDDLVFGPAALISYISTIFTLNPGDLVLTGTPGGVGHARKPGVYIEAGQRVTVTIDGVGEVANQAVRA